MKKALICCALLISILYAFGQDNVLAQAKTLAEQGKPKKAIEIIDASLLENPNQAALYRDKSIYLVRMKKYKEGINTLSYAIQIMPDSASLYANRGNLYEVFQMFDEAIKDYGQAIFRATEDSMKCSYLNTRGVAKSKIRNFKGAYKDLQKALRIDSTSINALNNMATICDEIGRSDETLKYLEKIIRLDSTFAPAYINMGYKLQMMGLHFKAITYFDKGIELEPEEAYGYSNRSYSRLKIKDFKGALSDINYSIKLLPTNSFAFRNRALIYLEKGKKGKACKDLEEALELGFHLHYGDEVQRLRQRYCN